MNKFTNRLATIIFGVSIFGMVTFVLLQTENEKRQSKLAAVENMYSQEYSSWETYKKAFDSQVVTLKEENAKKMDQAKIQYETLLAQQPSLVSAHSRLVAQNNVTSVSNSTSSGSTVSKTSTGTKTVKVTRPSSTPKTATS